MARSRQKGRRAQRTVATDTATAWLQADLPEAVKRAVRMAVKGGRQQQRRCACGARGRHCEVFVPHTAVSVGATSTAGLRVYWTCDTCHAAAIAQAMDADIPRWTDAGLL
jgi:hypothetical protein